MHTEGRHESAKIYQFPRRSSALGRSAHRDGNSAAIVRLPQLPVIDFGSGWYHEAAVQDAMRAGKS